MRLDGEYCTICRKPATAAWHGDGVIAVCPDCAVEVLPALMADAVYVPPAKVGSDCLKRHIDRAAAVYWRAMAVRMFNERKGATL